MKYFLWGLIVLLLIFSVYFKHNQKEQIKIVYKEIINPISEPFTFYKIKCNITGYNPTVEQCDDTPNITASNKAVRLGMVAVSRDLEKLYNLRFGDYVFIEHLGLFEFQDRLHKRIKNTIDILCWNKQTAYKLTNSGQTVYFIQVKK